MNVWPPDLEVLKDDMKITDSNDDTVLKTRLDAAVAFVERARKDLDFDGQGGAQPDDDVWLGTLALARRWYTRRTSPDGLVAMGDMGANRITTYDPDIDRQLRIGRFRRGAFA